MPGRRVFIRIFGSAVGRVHGGGFGRSFSSGLDNTGDADRSGAFGIEFGSHFGSAFNWAPDKMASCPSGSAAILPRQIAGDARRGACGPHEVALHRRRHPGLIWCMSRFPLGHVDDDLIRDLEDDLHAVRSALPERLEEAVARKAAAASQEASKPAPQALSQEAASEPAKRYATLSALRSDGFEPVGHGMYRKAHALWSVSMTDDGQVGVWRHAPEPSADYLSRDRSLVGRRGRAQVNGREAAVSVVHIDDEGVHVEFDAAGGDSCNDAGCGITETAVIPPEALFDVEEPDEDLDEAGELLNS